MTPPHNCQQDGRFDRVEAALDEIKDAIKQITDLMVSSARIDEKLKVITGKVAGLEKKTDDIETRLRPVETTRAVAQWLERVVLAVASGAICYFWSKGG